LDGVIENSIKSKILDDLNVLIDYQKKMF